MENDEKITRRFMPDVLRRYRDNAGLSQQELADSIGVSKGFISALEGGRSVPNLDRLVQIADALQVSPGELANAMLEDAAKELGKKIHVNKNK
ncbi:MAG: helix-turn-helix transcriptional regulator [Desulfovibrio sp.]|uniref:helix-turn-helix domain-containing protein n=1 Tax=Desulfovibrio sp. TaxID=885 RepID=UPI0039E3511D